MKVIDTKEKGIMHNEFLYQSAVSPLLRVVAKKGYHAQQILV
jgi:hypothetical protein